MSVAPPRLQRWLDGFAAAHGGCALEASAERVVAIAADGARAEMEVPFPPLAVDAARPWAGLPDHACAERRVGVLLVRLGGFAAGVFAGSQLIASKVGSRPVHGRSAAGGWSQKRFARRREGQVRAATAAAADAAARILLPPAAELDALVLGGDRHAVDTTLEDGRLASLRSRAVARFLDVPDPRQRVLERAHEACVAVRIRIVDAPGRAQPPPGVNGR